MADFDSVTIRIDAAGVTVEVHRDGEAVVETVGETVGETVTSAPSGPSPRSSSDI
jgi:hypothetical protein